MRRWCRWRRRGRSGETSGSSSTWFPRQDKLFVIVWSSTTIVGDRISLLECYLVSGFRRMEAFCKLHVRSRQEMSDHDDTSLNP